MVVSYVLRRCVSVVCILGSSQFLPEEIISIVYRTDSDMYNEMYTFAKYIVTETTVYSVLRRFCNYNTEDDVPTHVRVTGWRSDMIKVELQEKQARSRYRAGMNYLYVK